MSPQRVGKRLGWQAKNTETWSDVDDDGGGVGEEGGGGGSCWYYNRHHRLVVIVFIVNLWMAV